MLHEGVLLQVFQPLFNSDRVQCVLEEGRQVSGGVPLVPFRGAFPSAFMHCNITTRGGIGGTFPIGGGSAIRV